MQVFSSLSTFFPDTAPPCPLKDPPPGKGKGMTLSLTNTMPYPRNLPCTSRLSPLSLHFHPGHLVESRTLELEGTIEVLQLELCPTEFINTSLGLFLLLGPCILSPTSKHICTQTLLVQAPKSTPLPLKLCPVTPSHPCPVTHPFLISGVRPGCPGRLEHLPLPKAGR